MITILENLKAEVLENSFGLDNKTLFEGADVMIADIASPKEEIAKRQEYAKEFGEVLVVSKYAYQISALMFTLRDMFYEEKKVDYLNKYYFFGELAKAAQNSIDTEGDSQKALLYMLDRAIELNKEFSSPYFVPVKLKSNYENSLVFFYKAHTQVRLKFKNIEAPIVGFIDSCNARDEKAGVFSLNKQYYAVEAIEHFEKLITPTL